MDTQVLAGNKKTYIPQLFEDTGCHQDDLPRVLAERERKRERGDKSLQLLRLDNDDDDKILLHVGNIIDII